MLLMHCIDTSLNVRHVDVEVCTNGWPEDEKTLDDADSIVLLCDGAMKGVQHPLVRDHHMPALERQMKRGCGLVVIHWGLMLPSEIGNETFLKWIGGFKDYENPPRPIGEPLRLQEWSKQAAIRSRGVKPLEMPKDEKARRRNDCCRAMRASRRSCCFGKARRSGRHGRGKRKDGDAVSASAAGTGYAAWECDDLRMVLLNAILWTAHCRCPTTGRFRAADAVEHAAGAGLHSRQDRRAVNDPPRVRIGMARSMSRVRGGCERRRDRHHLRGELVREPPGRPLGEARQLFRRRWKRDFTQTHCDEQPGRQP